MRCKPGPHRSQRGYSLVELSVAITISLFLLAGLFSILQSTRDTSQNQSQLAQLQDTQRIGAMVLTDVIEQAGYYPNPYQTAIAGVFGVAAPFTQAGQVVAGTTNTDVSTTSVGDTLVVRYEPDSTGTLLGCTGQAGTAGTVHTYSFSIAVVGTTRALYCSVDGGTAVLLVNNVYKLNISYGTYSAGTTAGAPGAVDSYLTATQLNTNAVMWTNVYSVKFVLTFQNPLYGQPGQTLTSNQYITFTRVVSLMSRTGTNVSTFT